MLLKGGEATVTLGKLQCTVPADWSCARSKQTGHELKFTARAEAAP